MKAWLAADPGQKGAMVLLKEDNSFFYMDWTNQYEIKNKIKEWNNEYDIQAVCSENINLTGSNFRGVNKIMVNSGIWQGLLTWVDKPLHLLTPRVWQSKFLKKSDPGSDLKKKAFNVACRLYPTQIKDLKGARGGIKDGRVDALLMATYIKQFLEV